MDNLMSIDYFIIKWLDNNKKFNQVNRNEMRIDLKNLIENEKIKDLKKIQGTCAHDFEKGNGIQYISCRKCGKMIKH